MSLDDHLPLQCDPWEQQADGRIGGDVRGFAGSVVGEESETFSVERLE